MRLAGLMMMMLMVMGLVVSKDVNDYLGGDGVRKES